MRRLLCVSLPQRAHGAILELLNDVTVGEGGPAGGCSQGPPCGWRRALHLSHLSEQAAAVCCQLTDRGGPASESTADASAAAVLPAAEPLTSPTRSQLGYAQSELVLAHQDSVVAGQVDSGMLGVGLHGIPPELENAEQLGISSAPAEVAEDDADMQQIADLVGDIISELACSTSASDASQPCVQDSPQQVPHQAAPDKPPPALSRAAPHAAMRQALLEISHAHAALQPVSRYPNTGKPGRAEGNGGRTVQQLKSASPAVPRSHLSPVGGTLLATAVGSSGSSEAAQHANSNASPKQTLSLS